MPVRSRHRKHRRFIDLSAHKRRDAVIQLKWKIERNALQAGHIVFWTDHLMEDPDLPTRQHQWIDVVFLGRDRCTLWNAEIITTGLAVDDAISNHAHEVAYAKFSEEEAKSEFAMEFKPVPRKRPSDTRRDQPRPCCGRANHCSLPRYRRIRLASVPLMT